MPPNEPPHKYCEITNTLYNREMFLLWLSSGADISAFVFSPDHAKQLAKRLSEKVADYEKQFGPLEGRLPSEPMKSPFPMDGKPL